MTPKEYVNQALTDKNNETAFAFTVDKKGSINFSINSESKNISAVSDALAAIIESRSRKDPEFRQAFINSLAQINGQTALQIDNYLDGKPLIDDAEKTQAFVDEIMKMLNTEIRPTSAFLMLTNADPDLVRQDPTKQIPFIFNFNGDLSLLAYGISEAVNQFSGRAQAEGKPGAFDAKSNIQAVKNFNDTYSILNSEKDGDK